MEVIFEIFENHMIFQKLKFRKACSTKISSSARIHFRKYNLRNESGRKFNFSHLKIFGYTV